MEKMLKAMTYGSRDSKITTSIIETIKSNLGRQLSNDVHVLLDKELKFKEEKDDKRGLTVYSADIVVMDRETYEKLAFGKSPVSDKMIERLEKTTMSSLYGEMGK